ncbi:diguanylate cyclase [Psychrosphaera sp. 1_MG-2023]|uniref:diguanylate cyclase n=1 Tax=Psychrosphaera algicola TaxID=3023714 RepID=A0ABT5FH44_9GAMM|nr:MULTISPECIES: diguanylate cyclase [unclassified Psychrosphaera]MDC2890511.1 diguanylate cyclase [Psychrosphaera sp. G1-22]MDO6720972.1 diguanylate cyclase [Psychrosphaera sp. 1_MG-2023]
MEWKTVTSTERDIESHIRIKERVACDHLFNVQALYDIRLKDIVIFTVVYILLARFSQSFAIAPSHVSPIWIPSGVLFALALKYGVRVWPGVFVGVLFNNIWTYSSSTALIDSLIAGVFNGIGDVFSIIGSAALIYHLTKTNNPLHRKLHFAIFVAVGVILGPLISALFGVLGLSVFDFIGYKDLINMFFTWWVGDAVGVLVFTPLLISWFNPEQIHHNHSALVFFIIALPASLATAAIFDLIIMPIELMFLSTIMLPMLLVTMVHYGQRILFTIQLIVLAIAVTATSQNLGPFAVGDSNLSLIQLQWFVAIFSCSIFGLAVVTYENQNAKEVIFEKMKELEKLYRTDNLTGVANRHLITEFINREFSRMARTNLHFGVILIDLDNFKLVNDKFGHNVGDQVLIQMCEAIQLQIRTNDLLGRWGGEEFIVICDNIDRDGLMHVAEKIRIMIENSTFEQYLSLTISLGITLADQNDTINTLTKRADDGLYTSKRNGKNCSTYVDGSHSDLSTTTK